MLCFYFTQISCTFAPSGFCYMIFILGSFYIMIAKVKHWRKERKVSQLALQSVAVLNFPSQEENQSQVYNNQKDNQSIMNNVSLIVFGIVVILIFMPLMLIQTKIISFSNPLPYYIIFLVSSICLPSLYFLLKPKCLTAVFNVIFQSWNKNGLNNPKTQRNVF